MEKHEQYMRQAIRQAQSAARADEVPVGCVIVKDGKVIARARNRRQQSRQACAHAEVLCIGYACKKLRSWRLDGCEMYVTLEPCPMCAGAAVNARLKTVIFGAYDQKAGYAGTLHNTLSDSRLNHRPDVVGGVLERECAELLSGYFAKKRGLPKKGGTERG